MSGKSVKVRLVVKDGRTRVVAAKPKMDASKAIRQRTSKKVKVVRRG